MGIVHSCARALSHFSFPGSSLLALTARAVPPFFTLPLPLLPPAIACASRVFEAGQGSCGFPDMRADADECVADLAEFPVLNARSRSASARKLACLAHNYLRPWTGIPGVTAGMGARGMINPAMLQQMGTMANVRYKYSTFPPALLPHTYPHPVPFPPLSPPPPPPPRPALPFRPTTTSPWYFAITLPLHISHLAFDSLAPAPHHPPPSPPHTSTLPSRLYILVSASRPLFRCSSRLFPMLAPLLRGCANGCAQVLSCAGHVRIVRGKIFFRFGNFEFDWYRLRRFVFSVKMIQDAIREYKLHNLNAEFFLNTCDMYISKASSVAKPLAGLPIFSVHGAPGSIDILYPDPIDLSSNYFREAEDEIPWEQKESRAVFRGGMTNYKVIYPKHWRGSPRFRVHRMSDVRPDLLDARVVGGVDPEYRAGLRQDAISFGKRLGPADLQSYKYELDVDGGTGSGRVCGVLSSSQLLIKQASEYTQFFDPLMCPYRHFLPTHRFFSDLFGQIEWAKRNDGEARRIVGQANELARGQPQHHAATTVHVHFAAHPRRCGRPQEPDEEAAAQMAAQM
ncbi:unnamed protein product [Closterium sp. Yama58-4]|nr:unnamed protein product [Closterium sp. Yama58-4]